MIPKEGLSSQVCKKVITLGRVRDEKDFWYVSRICNEAFLELTQGEPGPVHIDFIVENDYPIHHGVVRFDEKKLPGVKKIEWLTLEDDDSVWKRWSEKQQRAKVLITYGQHGCLIEPEKRVFRNLHQSIIVFSLKILSQICMLNMRYLHLLCAACLQDMKWKNCARISCLL